MAGEKKSKRKIIIAIIVVLLLMSAIGNCTGGNKSTPSSSSAESASDSAASAEMTKSSTASNSNESEGSRSQNSTSAEAVKSKEATDEASGKAETEQNKKGNLAEEHAIDIIAASSMTLDNYISNYDISLAPQNWTIAMWDGEAVVAITDVTLSGGSVKQTAIVVLTPTFEGNKITSAKPHFISVGDTVYGDDVFAKLQEISAAQD